LETFPVIVYGVLMFLGAEIVSVPFGAISKFQELKGISSSPRAQSWISFLEYALECAVVIWFTFKVSQTQLQINFLPGLTAFSVAVLVAYPFDVLWAKQSLRQFGQRALFAAVFCVPVGVYIAGWSTGNF
jgi:hypothetical protein